MKKYTMIEMLNEIRTNPEKEFRSIPTRALEEPIHVVMVDDCIYFKNSSGKHIPIYYACLTWRWEEVKKPVTFMEAIKAFRKGKSIYCNDGNKNIYYPRKEYSVRLENTFGNPVTASEILDGEWYIEDEDVGGLKIVFEEENLNENNTYSADNVCDSFSHNTDCV